MTTRAHIKEFIIFSAIGVFFLSLNLIPLTKNVLTPITTALRNTLQSEASNVRYLLKVYFTGIPLAPETASKNDYVKLLREVVFYRQSAKNNQMFDALRQQENGTALKIIRVDLNGDIIAEGTQKKIDYVMDKNFSLVGIVSGQSVQQTTIKTILSQDLQFSVMKGDGTYLGLTQYQGIGFLKVEFIPEDKNIQIDDAVVTAGKDSFFKENILVGKIIGIKDSGFYQTAIVKPFFNIDETDLVIGKSLFEN